MNHSKLFTVISTLFATSKTKKKSIATSSIQSPHRIILSILGLILFSITAIQSSSNVGTIDTDFGTNGTLEVPGELTIHPMSMQIFNSGDILLGVSLGTSAANHLVELTSNYLLNTTSFGVDLTDATSGISVSLPTQLVNINNIMTDHAGDLYIVGDNGTQASVVKMKGDGSAIVWHTETLGLSAANCVVEQASGRILVSGYISPYGVIVAYDPNTGAVDTSFNQGSVNPGYYFTVYNNPVTSLSIIDDTDKILFTYANYGTGVDHKVQLNRLLENGAFDTDLTLIGTPINSFTYNNTIKMQQDVDNKIVVVASVGDGFMASRYNADGSDNVINTHILVDAVHVGSSSLKNILCLSDGTTLILGTNSYSGSTYLVLAKLKSDFTLDTIFNPAGTVPGVLNTVVTSPVTMTNFYALGMSTVAPYDILVAGDDGTNPYVIGVVSGLSSAVTPTNQSTTTWGFPGTLDTTYNAGHNDSHEAGFFDLGNEIDPGFAGESVQAMLQNSDGSYFVVSSWITPGYDPNSYVMKFNSDDTKNTTFGNGTFITISGMATAHDMILMQDGNLLIVGETSQNYCRIVCLNPSTGEVVGLFDISWEQFFYNNAVVQQSNGRLIISGAWLEEDGTTKTPALLALNPLTFEMDFTFGDGGIYRYPALSITTPQGIGNMVIDDNGDIYFIIQYSDSGNPVGVYKLSNTGVGPVLWTGNQGISSLGDSRYNQIARDQNGNIVVASSGDSSSRFINVYRFDSNDGNILQTNSFAYATTGITYPLVSGLMIDQTSPTGNIILCGHNGTSPDNPFVMRVLSDLSAVDTTFNAAPAAKPGVQPITVTAPASSGGSWGAGFISANGKITVGGYATISSTSKPYLMRLYGNDFIGEYSQSIDAGVPGNLNLGFGDGGYFSLSNICENPGVFPVVVLPMADGYQYIAFDDGTLVRLTNSNELDTTFGLLNDGFAATAPVGVSSMIMDANGCLVLVGTDQTPQGWIVRYAAGDSGAYDSTFNQGNPFYFEIDSIATCVVEQTLSRLVVGGQRTDVEIAHGILWALTNTGALDVTFNSNDTPGNYSTVGLDIIPSLVADEYDRLIFACKGIEDSESDIYLVRITASGEYETDPELISSFGLSDDEEYIRVCLDVDGNIVVAAIADEVLSVIAYDQDFNVVRLCLPIVSLTNPELIDLIATADGKILMSGYYRGDSFGGTWVARVKTSGQYYILDDAFNPTDDGYGDIQGVMQIEGPIIITSIAIYGDGELTMVAGTIGGPSLLRAYNNPYTSQEAICQYVLPIGTNDPTFGVTTNVANGITFFATQDVIESAGFQSAQAIALQDDQNIVVALNVQQFVPMSGGRGEIDQNINIVINMFDVDGLLNTSFNSSAQPPCNPGQAIVLDAFDNQYVQDMMTFTTVDGVHKAILAGYATNNTLQVSNSLLIQFDLRSAVIDEDTFGGFNGDPQGVAMGNGPSQAFTLGRQSMGRIIVGGVSPSINSPSFGLLQAYTASGLLDQSFGQAGYFTQGITGIYSAVIDSQDRVVCLYGDGSGGMILARILADGSGLDTTFNPDGGYPGWYEIDIDTLPGTVPTNNCKVALDSSGNIFIVAATIESVFPIDIVFIQFDQNGTLVVQNTFVGNSSFGGLTNFTITKILITATQDSGDDNIMIVGYDQAIAGNQIMVVSLVHGEFGWELNEEGFNAEETSGYIKYAVGNSSSQTSAGAIIHPDGRVIIAGSVDNNIPG